MRLSAAARSRLLLARLTLAAVGIALAATLAGCSGSTSTPNEAQPASQNATEQVVPAELTDDQFYDDSILSESRRIHWADGIVDERGAKAYDEINSILISHKHDALHEYIEPSESNTGNEILTQQSVVNYVASTAITPDEGRKILAAYTAPENPGFETSMNQVGGGGGAIVTSYEVVTDNDGISLESPVFHRTPVGTYTPDGRPSKVITVRNKLTQKVSQVTVSFTDGRWITRNTIGPEDQTAWIVYPERMQAN